jgi:hypothetical protein
VFAVKGHKPFEINIGSILNSDSISSEPVTGSEFFFQQQATRHDSVSSKFLSEFRKLFAEKQTARAISAYAQYA